jgi:streptogramin lyase
MAYNGTVTAEVNGLESGSTLDLQINNNETLSVSSNGKSSFRTPLPVNSSYSVSLKDNQPPGFQWCAITNGSGTVTDSSNIVAVGCTSASGKVTTISGRSGAPGSNDATLIDATFNTPRGLVFDSKGNLYVNDAGNMVIRKIDTLGVVSTFAGVMGQAGANDGVYGTGKLGNSSSGIAIDKEDNLYIADTENNTIRKIDIYREITTIAGVAGPAGYENGPALNARFNQPSSLAFDSLGNIFVADYGNQTIRKIDTSGVVTLFAGTPNLTGDYYEPVDGAPNEARLITPKSILFDGKDTLYVADRNQGVRKIDQYGNVSSLTPNIDEVGDNTNVIAKDRWGNLYVGGVIFRSFIEKIAPSGTKSILAGARRVRGFSDGKGGLASFEDITGLAVDSSGNLYTTESQNHSIRKIVPAAP